MKKIILFVVLLLNVAWSVEVIYHNDGNLRYEGIYKKKFYLKVFENNEGVKTFYLMQKIPHYPEYDRKENPSGYNWCGYAAMKSAVKGVLDKYATLKSFADASIFNGYTNNYNDDIYINHLHYLAFNKVKFSGTYLKNHVEFLQKQIKSSEDLFRNVINTTLNNKGAVLVVYADYFGYPGHYYVIVGLKFTVDQNNNREYYYLLRDVALEKPRSVFFDRTEEIESFYENLMGNSNNYNIKPAINVVPGFTIVTDFCLSFYY